MFGAINKALSGGLGAALGGGALGLAHKAVGNKGALKGKVRGLIGGGLVGAGIPRPKIGSGGVRGAAKGALAGALFGKGGGKGGGKTQKPMPKRPKK